MRATNALAVMSLSAALTLGCQPAAPQFTAQDEAAVRARFDATPGYVMKGDWAAFAAQYAENGFLQPPNAPTVTGRAAVQKWGEAFPKVDNLSFTNVQVSGEGNMAYGTSAYTLKLKDPAMPTDTGKQLCVLHRAAGKWEVTGCSFNSDLPLPMPAPAPPPAKKK